MTSGADGRCVDSGVIVAAFAPWHERHSDAIAVMVDKPQAVAHSLVETYSVLTRLPAPFRAPATVLATFWPGDSRTIRWYFRPAILSGCWGGWPQPACTAALSTTRSSVPPPARPTALC